jgi:SNF2 family DNA or RNA helicase
LKYVPKLYQKKIQRWIHTKKRCAVHVDMGLGKTVATLTVFAELLDNWAVRGLLVIAPIRVCTDTWPSECQKWDHLRHLDVALLRAHIRKLSRR